MNGSPGQEQSWSRLRWGLTIAAVVALHFVLLGAVGNQPVKPIEHKPVPQMILPVSLPEQLQLLTDPTLFVLGGSHGFSSVWMAPTSPPPVNQVWKGADQWLNIKVSRLGAGFVEFARSSATPLHGLTFKVAPHPFPLDATDTAKPLRQKSNLRVTGELANRGILNRPELPAQTAGDLLTNSVVRAMVDSRGIVTSAILLPPGSDSEVADQFALESTRKLRFAPAPGTETTLGTVVFEWLTVPLTNTNESAQ